MRLTLDLPAGDLDASVDDRRVTGTLVPYGTTGRTSIGDVTVRAGAITVPDTLNRVRLLAGHNRENPIGVLVDLEDTPAAMRGTFHVARTDAGNTYLAELDPAAPIRDGLSVELDDVTVTAGEVTAGRLVAVAAVPLPAYPDARAALAAEDHPPTEGAPVSDTTPTDAGTPAPEATPEPATVTAAAAPTRSLNATTPARTRPVSYVAEVAQRLTAARLEGNTAMRAALADITPTGNGAGNEDAGLMVQALGELWSGVDYVAQYRDKINGGRLTGAKVTGFAWDTPPTVADYAGDKTDVPSNAAKLGYVEVPASRLAGAHDIDRIYRDLGTADVLASYWRQMAYSLAVQLDARGLDLIELAAGAVDTTPTSSMEALIRGSLKVNKVGRPTFAIVAANLYEAMALESTDAAPVGADLIPPITPSDAVPDNYVVVGTRNAARLLTFDPPVRVEAVNIPNGGIDAGLFSYSAGVVELSAGVSAYSVLAAPPVAAKASSK